MCIRDRVKDELVSLGVDESKVLVFHNAFTANKQVTDDKHSLRKRYGLNDDDIVVVAIGHTVHVKGWDVLIEAFHSAKKNQKNLKLLLVGSFSDKHEEEVYKDLRIRIEKYSIQKDVIFTGYLFNIQEPLRAADMYVLTSRAEGFGNVLLEAIVEKLPCISTDVGIASQVIKDNENGFIVRINHHKEISEKISLLCGSPKLRKEMSNNAVIPECIPSREEYAQRTVKLYSSLLGETE